MGRALIAMAMLVGCGRIGFDSTTALAPGDGPATVDGIADALGQPAIPTGVGIWLRMETNPAAAIDSAGGHTISCNGTCPTRVPGLHGNGYRFTTQQLEVAYAADLDSSGGFSAGVWVNLASYQTVIGEGCVWTKPFDDTSGFDTFTLCIDSSGNAVFDSETQAGVTDTFTGGTVPLGTWHHVAVTWDGHVKTGFVDGVQVGSSATTCGSSTQAFQLGSSRFASPSYFIDGIVDDAVYYTRALSPAEVMQLATP